MKEIDFLPEEYKAGKRKKTIYKRQYMIVGCLFGMLTLISFFAGRVISPSQASSEGEKIMSAEVLAEYEQMKSRVSDLKSKKNVLDRLDTHVNYAAVLAELSNLINDRIVLSKIDMRLEAMTQDTPARVIVGVKQDASVLPEQDLRLKVNIEGIAVAASDVADLIGRIEDSSYFVHVTPGYSKITEMKGKQFAQFQIACYLANYK